MGIRYIICDGCENKIQINTKVYKKHAECGIYCSPQCFANVHAESVRLTEFEADNCFKEVLEVE